MLTATLTWFRDRRIDAANTLFDDSYDDLNLELWSVVDGGPTSLISESSSLYNESEHFSFALPFTGDYALRVRWFQRSLRRGCRCRSGTVRPGVVGGGRLRATSTTMAPSIPPTTLSGAEPRHPSRRYTTGEPLRPDIGQWTVPVRMR